VAKAKATKKPKAPKEKPPSKRGRQKGEAKHLPGMEPTKDADIHPVAIEYVRARAGRMEYGAEEAELKLRLIALMEKKGLTSYEYDDVNVVMTNEHKLKVKKGGKDTGE